MAEIIPVQHAVYNKSRFSKVIDTQFTEFAIETPVAPEVTVEDFFKLYAIYFLWI